LNDRGKTGKTVFEKKGVGRDGKSCGDDGKGEGRVWGWWERRGKMEEKAVKNGRLGKGVRFGKRKRVGRIWKICGGMEEGIENGRWGFDI
jgi:hypothetical protein